MVIVNNKEIPESLSELLLPSCTAHVVIDLQNDCCHPEGAYARAGGDMSAFPSVIETVSSLIDETLKLGVLQIFVKVISLANGLSDSPAWIWLQRRLSMQYGDESANVREPEKYCLKDSWGAELVDGLQVLEGNLVIEKHRSSAFFKTNLDMLLRSNGIQALIFTGCTTEGCVESTVRDAGFLGYFPVVVRDGVASHVHSLHEASLRVMSAHCAAVATARAAVVTAAEVLEAVRVSR